MSDGESGRGLADPPRPTSVTSRASLSNKWTMRSISAARPIIPLGGSGETRRGCTSAGETLGVRVLGGVRDRLQRTIEDLAFERGQGPRGIEAELSTNVEQLAARERQQRIVLAAGVEQGAHQQLHAGSRTDGFDELSAATAASSGSVPERAAAGAAVGRDREAGRQQRCAAAPTNAHRPTRRTVSTTGSARSVEGDQRTFGFERGGSAERPRPQGGETSDVDVVEGGVERVRRPSRADAEVGGAEELRNDDTYTWSTLRDRVGGIVAPHGIDQSIHAHRPRRVNASTEAGCRSRPAARRPAASHSTVTAPNSRTTVPRPRCIVAHHTPAIDPFEPTSQPRSGRVVDRGGAVISCCIINEVADAGTARCSIAIPVRSWNTSSFSRGSG